MRLFQFLLLLGLGVVAANAAQSENGSAAQVQLHEQRAHQFLNEKKTELAAKEFAAVLAADSHNLDAQGNLGVLLYFQKNYAAAEPHLRSAIELQPDLTKIRALLGMCERRLGKTEAARADLQAVVGQLQETGIRQEVGLELIQIYTASQELEKAANVATILQQGTTINPEVLYASYRIYTDLAGEMMLDLSIAAPDSGQMHQLMAHELVREQNLNGAIANLRKALATDPNLPGIHFELAEALHSSPDSNLRAEAEQQYKLAIAADHSNERAMARLGDLEAEKSDFNGASTYYKQALQLQPDDVDAALGLAHVLTETNDPTAALLLLEHVTTTDPTNGLAHYRLNEVYRKLNRPEDAKREFEAWQKSRDDQEKLRQIYKELRLEAPRSEEDK